MEATLKTHGNFNIIARFLWAVAIHAWSPPVRAFSKLLMLGVRIGENEENRNSIGPCRLSLKGSSYSSP